MPAPFTAAGIGAGIVLQDPGSQLVMERVGDDVAFGLENLGWGRAAMTERVGEALAGVGLKGFEARRSTRLSGGEQQRVAIAGVLAPGPGVLVLDEPTAHLDAGGAEAVFAILRSIRDRGAATIVLVEHRAALSWPLADVVLALGDDGRPIDAGPPKDVLKRSAARLERAGIWLPDQAPGTAAVVEGAKARPAGRTRGGGRPSDAIGSEPVLDVDEVRFGFSPDAPVLRAVDLELRPGERVALAGRNGAGKTTLLRLALGLLQPVAGRVRLGGREPRRLSPLQLARLAGFVAQEPELGFIGPSVREEIEIGLAPEELVYAHALAERLRLPLGDFGERSPYRLSGGEQRRLSLVAGLARRPLLLALDEPTFGQDRRGHEALVAALAELVGQGSAMLAATHDERFILDAADRRVELADGWVLADERVTAGAAS
jgi:energy-coupling factor transporter ATP-binding protein EcfA2